LAEASIEGCDDIISEIQNSLNKVKERKKLKKDRSRSPKQKENEIFKANTVALAELSKLIQCPIKKG